MMSLCIRLAVWLHRAIQCSSALLVNILISNTSLCGNAKQVCTHVPILRSLIQECLEKHTKNIKTIKIIYLISICVGHQVTVYNTFRTAPVTYSMQCNVAVTHLSVQAHKITKHPQSSHNIKTEQDIFEQSAQPLLNRKFFTDKNWLFCLKLHILFNISEIYLSFGERPHQIESKIAKYNKSSIQCLYLSKVSYKQWP